jgi:hypothetical protein
MASKRRLSGNRLARNRGKGVTIAPGAHWGAVGVIPDVKVPVSEAQTRVHRLALEAILKDAQACAVIA